MTLKPKSEKPLTARIEVFRPGTFTPMEGEPITYSAADLRALADAYDPAVAPAPVVVGHPATDAPAYGWIESLDYDAAEGRLFANLNEIEPAFADLVKAGRFKKVSMSFFAPSQGHNPVPGTWYPKHVGFLGAAAPAVSGLKNAQFAGDGAVEFETAFGAADESASLFRKLRDLLIEKFGIEDADKALPSWQIEWLDDADEPDRRFSAAPDQQPAASDKPETQEKEPAVDQQNDAAFAEREAALAEREARMAEQEAKITHADHAAFAEGLVQAGKLLPAVKDKVVALLDVLPGDAAVSFSEGSAKITPVAALKEILEAQLRIVSFGETDLAEGDDGKGKPAAFAADGHDVDAAQLAIHNKALAWQRTNPGTAYLDAVRAVS